MRKIEDNPHAKTKIPMVILMNGLFGCLIGVALLFIFSMFIAKEVLPENAMRIIPAVVSFVGTFISAFASSKTLGRTLLTSLIQSVSNIALFYIAGLIVFMRIVPANLSLSVFLACVAGAVLGGFIAAGGKKKHRAM